MRRRWTVILTVVAAVLLVGGLIGWWYADRTVIARMASRDGTDAVRAGDLVRAEERFSAAIRKFPAGSAESARAHLWRAQVRRDQGAFDAAYTDADQALRVNSSATGARTVRAQVAYKLGRYDEAKADFDQVLQAKPESGIAHYYLALIAERKGDLPTAHAHVLHAIRDDAFFARGHAAFARIVRAEGNPTAAEKYEALARDRDPNVRLEIE